MPPGHSAHSPPRPPNRPSRAPSPLDQPSLVARMFAPRTVEGPGDVAQLAERRVRNAKVVGSTPIVSTRTTRAAPQRFCGAALVPWGLLHRDLDRACRYPRSSTGASAPAKERLRPKRSPFGGL